MGSEPEQPVQPATDGAPAPSAPPIDGAGPARRRAGRLGLPAGASVGLHALLMIGAGLIVWDIAWRSPAAGGGPEVYISFEEPRRGSSPAAPATPGAERERPSVPAPEAAPAPAAAPVLEGLATAASQPASPLRPAPAEPADVVLASSPPPGVEVKFAGLGASSARSVVYVIDGSGPMVTSLSVVMAEVERSIGRLGPSQRFGVIVFRKRQKPRAPEPGLSAPTAMEEPAGGTEEGGGDDAAPGYEWFTPALVRATPEAKQRIGQWLGGEKPGGRSTPMEGLRAAIGMNPDAIFLLSRSIERSGGGVWDLGLKRTMEELERLNPIDPETGRRPIIIKTIQFLDEDPTGIMQSIGRQHGGTGPGAAQSAYTVIKRGQDLAARPPQ